MLRSLFIPYHAFTAWLPEVVCYVKTLNPVFMHFKENWRKSLAFPSFDYNFPFSCFKQFHFIPDDDRMNRTLLLLLYWPPVWQVVSWGLSDSSGWPGESGWADAEHDLNYTNSPDSDLWTPRNATGRRNPAQTQTEKLDYRVMMMLLPSPCFTVPQVSCYCAFFHVSIVYFYQKFGSF